MGKAVSLLLLIVSFCGTYAETLDVGDEVPDVRGKDVKIFEFHQLEKDHACSLIRCSEDEVCALLDNVALCMNRRTANHILRKAEGRSTAKLLPPKKRTSKKHKNAGTAPKIDDFDGMQHFAPKHIEDYDQACTEKQLVTIEDLLVRWFTSLRMQSTNAEAVSLPKHHLRCQPDVGWMFVQLDGNGDGHLEHDELYTLDHEKYKNCIHHFLDQCDLNQDALLSVDEWCDCFEWAGREREEPPCHAARRLTDPHLIGSFMPECNVEGYYRPEQCHGDHCWCVDKWGREFDHSRTIGHADCGQYSDHISSTNDDNSDDDDDDNGDDNNNNTEDNAA
uniref:Thyroglobulin type-1 domain-containing protein n=1 Tax=Trichuris muris TaxID=70415 RepID=A0A5S6R5M7_TRIMR